MIGWTGRGWGTAGRLAGIGAGWTRCTMSDEQSLSTMGMRGPQGEGRASDWRSLLVVKYSHDNNR